MSVTITGYSDDLIEVDGDLDEEFSYNDEDGEGDYLAFSDGTVLRIRFTSEGDGVWRITPVVRGSGDLTIEQAPEDDESNYSDVATLTDVRWVVQGIAIAKADALREATR